MDAYQREYDEKQIEEYLNEIYGTISICGMEYEAGYALRSIDPIAFRCVNADLMNSMDLWFCGECDNEFDNREEAEECCTEED